MTDLPPRAVLADSGPLYAARDPDDQHHARATTDLERLATGRVTVFVPYSIVLESYSLVLHRLGAREARGFASELASGARFLDASPADYTAAIERARRTPDQRLTLFDTLTAILAQRLELPVWTFGHHFDVMRVPVWR